MAQIEAPPADRRTGGPASAAAGRTPAGTARRRRIHPLVAECLVALVVGLLIALLTTWPLARSMGSLAFNGDDTAFQAWTIDHVQWAVTGGHPLWDANIFAPNPGTLAYSDSLLGVAIPLIPLRWLGLGPIAIFNVALLLGMATSFAGGYLFGRVVSGRRTVGAVVAVAFAFGPAGTSWSGHLHATVHVGVAVAAVAAWWLADRAERGGKLVAPAALLVAAVVWQLSVSVYPGIYAAGAAGIISALRWRSLGRRGALALAGSAAVGAVLGVLLFLRYLEVVREGRQFVTSAGEVAGLGGNFSRPEPRLEFWSSILPETTSGQPMFPGVVLPLLAVVGLVIALRGGPRWRRVGIVGLTFAVIGVVLALGTSDTGWLAYSPYRLLFEVVPGFKIIRAAYRAWVLGLLGVGLLAGVACSVGARRAAARLRLGAGAASALAATLVVALVVLEGLAPWTDRPRVEVSEADLALGEDPRPGGVLYLPALLPDGPLALVTNFGQAQNVLGTTAHHRPTPNGYSGFVPEEFKELSARMRAFPSDATVAELREADIRFVVVRDWAVGTPWEPLLDPAQAAPLRLVGRYDGDLLYELPPADR